MAPRPRVEGTDWRAAPVVYEGTIAIEGHFRTPGEIRTRHARSQARTDGRARGLLTAIEKRALDVETIAQSWPLRDTPATLPLAELRALAAR